MPELEEPAATGSNETPLQSFIVRIWVESLAEDESSVQWRGSVQHVNSGDKQYVDEMEEIVAFLESHLAQLNVSLKPAGRPWWRNLLRRGRR